MAIDARVPLGALSTTQQRPLDLLGMANQAAQLQVRRQEAQESANKQRALSAFQAAVQESDGDYDRALDMLDQRGFGDAALSLRGDLEEYRTKSFKTLEQKNTARQKELDFYRNLAGLVVDDETQQALFRALSPEMRIMAQRAFGDAYDPQRAQAARDTLLTESEREARRKQAFEEFKDARNFQAGTAERRAKEVSALGGYLSTATTPQEYAAVLERAPSLGISAEVARMFQGKTAEQAGQMAISPKDRADDARMQARDAEMAAERARDNARADAHLGLARQTAARLAEQAANPQSRPISQTAEANIINRLTNQWAAANKSTKELDRAVSIMDEGLKAARRGDLAAGSQAILVTFQKILDPTSVVRESEYARSAAGQSLINRIAGGAERLAQGGAGVRLGELEKFAQLARDMANAQRSTVGATRKRLEATADRYNIPRELVLEGDAGATVATTATPDTRKPAYRFDPKTGKLTKVP